MSKPQHEPPDHMVGFYEREDALVSAVTEFLAPAVHAGSPVIALLDPEQTPGVETALGVTPLHIREVPAAGGFAVLDAPAILGHIRRGGQPALDRFRCMMRTLIDRLASDHEGFRIVVHMAAPSDETEFQAALALEDCWNELASSRGIAVFCAYPIAGFDTDQRAASLRQLCRKHATIALMDSPRELPGQAGHLRTLDELDEKFVAILLRDLPRSEASRER